MFQMRTKNIDKILIILQVLLNIYENNHITEIRRSVLKDRCDDELFKKTEGREDTYGGSLERYLKELKEEKALEIIHKSKKNTIIVPNITRIKHLLTSQRLSGLLDESTPHFTEEEIQQSTWEEIIEKEVGTAVDNIVKELVQRSNTLSKSFSENSMIKKSHPLMREVTKKIASSLASTLYEFYIIHKKDNRFELDEQTIIDLGIVARRITSSTDPTSPFRLVVEYKGVAEDKNKLGLFLGPSLYKIMAEYFVKWSHTVFNYEVTEDEKRMISETRIDQLTDETKQYYDRFSLSILPLYMDLWNASNKSSHEHLSQLGLKV